jgi:hypothetical protein
MYIWAYVWTESARWKRIRQDAPLEHLRGMIPLPRCADGFVRLATIAGNAHNRRPSDVTSVEFGKHAADRRGFMTEAQHHRHMIDAMEMVGASPEMRRMSRLFRGEADPAPNVVDAASVFARRRYDAVNRWQPSAEVLQEFWRVVNERVGRMLGAPR